MSKQVRFVNYLTFIRIGMTILPFKVDNGQKKLFIG